MYKEVMIIDDSDIDRFILEILINRISFAQKVIGFGSGMAALDHLRSLGNDHEKYPDVILLDIQMQVMNGFDFLDAYMTLPEAVQQHCYLVMASSSTNNKDYNRMKQYPVVRGFIEKPITEEMLASIQFK